MPQLIHVKPRSQRLKGLDEFETPTFVGRKGRVRRRRALMWWSMLGAATLVGGALGWLVF